MVGLLGCGSCHTDGALVGAPESSRLLAGSGTTHASLHQARTFDFYAGAVRSCLIDQLVGQYMAHVCGLGYLHDPQRVRAELILMRWYSKPC